MKESIIGGYAIIFMIASNKFGVMLSLGNKSHGNKTKKSKIASIT